MAQQQQFDENGNPIYSADTNSPNTGVNGPAPPAAPQVKPFDRTAFRDAINGASNAYDVLGQYGLSADKSGRVTLPTGEVMDVIRGAGAGGTAGQWIGVGDKGGTYGVNGYGAASGSVSGGAPAGANMGGKWDALYGELMTRAHQGLAVDPNNPVIKGQTDAFAAAQERSRRDFLNSQAERGSPYGTGAQLGQERMTAEKAGQATSGFQSELMGREVQAKRDEIAQALSGAQGMLSQEQQLSLQRELALMDNEIKRQQVANQQSQFNDTLDFNKNDRGTYWDWTKQGGKTN